MSYSSAGVWVALTVLIPTILFLLTISVKGLSLYIVKNIGKVDKLSNVLYTVSAVFWGIGIAITVIGGLILLFKNLF